MFTANVASSSSPNAGGGASSSSSNRDRGENIGSGGGHAGNHHRGDHVRESHASINVSELHCEPDSCLDSSHHHFKHSAVATAAAVAVCTYSGGDDGLSDEARIEKTAIEFKRAMNLQKARDRLRSIAKCKTLAYLSFVAFIIVLTLILIVLAALGVFNIN